MSDIRTVCIFSIGYKTQIFGNTFSTLSSSNSSKNNSNDTTTCIELEELAMSRIQHFFRLPLLGRLRSLDHHEDGE
jgi:hypothetical protein